MWDFGRVEALEPEAIGAPGKRTFRLRARSDRECASLWLEKEQLAQLTLALRELLARTGADDPAAPRVDSAGFPANDDVEFKIGRLGIGYDERRRMVVLFAYEIAEEEDEQASPTFACQASPAQCRGFAERAEEVISAGRPVCFLCGAPIDPEGHVCPRANGHSDHPISLE